MGSGGGCILRAIVDAAVADNSDNQKFVEIWDKLWTNEKQKLLGMWDEQMWGRKHFSAPAFFFSALFHFVIEYMCYSDVF